MGDNSPPEVDNGVLQTIAHNAGAQRDTEADDLALAKAMQEQERAFHWLASQPAQPNAQAGTASHVDAHHQQQEQQQAQPSGELSDLGAENTAPPPQRPAGGAAAAPEGRVQQGDGRGGSAAAGAATATGLAAPEDMSDAELALMLQREEQQAHLLELAGYEEGGFSDEDEEGYLSEDSVDPDEMTYEELQALGEAVGSVSRGLPPSLAAALPRRLYSQLRRASAQDDEQCAVCREEYLQGQQVASLPCSHFYHPACIAQWLQHQKVCPICGQEVAVSGVPYELPPQRALPSSHGGHACG